MRLTDRHYAIGFAVVALGIGLAEWLSPAQQDVHTIVVTPAMREFVQTQVASSGRNTPSVNPERALEQVIEEEILYREGVRLGLNEDDLIVKRRVVQKMRFLLEANTPLDEPTESQLQAWLNDHPEQFNTEAAVRMQHLFFARNGAGGEAMGKALMALKNDPHTNATADAHPFSNEQTWLGQRQLSRELGQFVSDQVLALPVGQWSAPIESGLGVHLFKVIEKTHSRQKTIAEAGIPLKAAVRETQRERMNEASLAAIMSRYRVEQEQ